MGDYAIIGLGQFGKALARSLARAGQSVMVLDRHAEEVQEISSEVDAAVTVDATDEKTLLELGLQKVSTAVVTIGLESMEASILTTALLRQIGVPRVVARAVSELHERVLRSVGAHVVINPEQEMGHRLAQRLIQPSIKDALEMGRAVVAEVDVPAQLAGKNLRELDIRNRLGVSVVAIRRGEEVLTNPGATEALKPGDILVVFGERDDVQRLATLV
ncbi:MAG TPA: TrkA family potassium uptake protein [Myxococcota bacterium]|nr:TrkA family potassium uptake protein [Myxococcota bacterium]HRY92158.1 TrkA family potassium uptake protein [Myxococcota bacterium]HSA20650.1 TrkA family potassium uptake protein [Myxococcota bacterium]